MRLLLAFFGVASVQQYNELWDANFAGISFRQTITNTINREAIAAWLRKGELAAQAIDCQLYGVHQFRDALEEIRHLTVGAVEHVWTCVEEVCARAGVAAVIIPDLPNTGLCGASRWLNPHKAVIQLSLRYQSDDQFWFSFFHEAGHILRHGKSKLYIQLADKNSRDATVASQEEDEANQFAADFLILPTELRRFLDNHQNYEHISRVQVLNFAEELGIAPGIVVGRLQHDERLPKKNMNKLKRSLQWTKDGQVVTVARE